MDRIFIDMDGVLFDFVGAVCELFGTTEDEIRKKWEPNNWDVCEPIGFTEEDMWRAIDAKGVSFWADMKPYPWATDLWDHCYALVHGKVAVLSKPSRAPSAMSGKLEALQRWHHEGERFRDFLIGPSKNLCARLGTVLIDDSNKNVCGFRNFGGEAILFPRYWNDAHELEAKPMAVTRLLLLGKL